jgi:hypothetical protein
MRHWWRRRRFSAGTGIGYYDEVGFTDEWSSWYSDTDDDEDGDEDEDEEEYETDYDDGSDWSDFNDDLLYY